MILVSTSTVEITPKEQYLPCYVSGNPLRDEKTDKVHDRFEWTVIGGYNEKVYRRKI